MTKPQTPRFNWIDRTAAWLLPWHPATGLISLILLSTRAGSVVRGFRTQPRDLLIWAVLGLVGVISVCQGADVGRGAVNWLVPFVFIWLYGLGRWSIGNPRGFLIDLVHATGVLALVVLVVRFSGLNLSVAGVTLLDPGVGGRGNVLGQAANGLAVVLEVGAVGGLAWVALARTAKERLIAAGVGISCLVAIFTTLSRGAMVGIAASAIAGGLLLNWRLLALVMGVGTLAIGASPLLRDRVLSILDVSRNVQRLRVWKGSLNLLHDHPWFGVGPGNFGLVYPQYRLPEEYQHLSTPHNLYLNITTGWGIPGGLILFGWIAWVVFRNLGRAMAPYKKATFLILVAFWVHVIFDDLITAQVGLLLGCLDRDDS